MPDSDKESFSKLVGNDYQPVDIHDIEVENRQLVIDLILDNQKSYMLGMDDLIIPEDKPLYEHQDCSSCKKCYSSSKKNFKYKHNSDIHRCKIWNCMIIKENIKCSFYKPVMITGTNQLIMNTIKLAYPKSIRADSFSEFEIKKNSINEERYKNVGENK